MLPFTTDIHFAHPWLLLLLAGVPLFFYYYHKRLKKNEGAFSIPTDAGVRHYAGSQKYSVYKNLYLLRLACFVFLIIALARPQTDGGATPLDKDGIDIVSCLDVSGSMMGQDFVPNRLEAAKKVVLKFVSNRTNDRIGLVIFSGESFTLCPLTADHGVLETLIPSIQSGMLKDGTAIGMGLATAADRLRESKTKSKVIILLTDGINNAGFIDPMTAAEVAQKLKIRVYTIGVGSLEGGIDPLTGQKQPADQSLDEVLLTKIAKMTGGEYFRATDAETLKNIYSQIDKMEKSKIQSAKYNNYSEEFYLPAYLASLLLLLEILLRLFYTRTINYSI